MNPETVVSERYPTEVTAKRRRWTSQQHTLNEDGSIQEDGDPEIQDKSTDAQRFTLSDGSWNDIEFNSEEQLHKYAQILTQGKDPTYFFAEEGLISITDEIQALINDPQSFFEDHTFDLAVPRTQGTVEAVSLDAVYLAWEHNGENIADHPEVNAKLSDESNYHDTLIVSDRSEAIHTDLYYRKRDRAIWKIVTPTGELLFYEYRPFENRVTAIDEFATQMDTVLNADTEIINDVCHSIKSAVETQNAPNADSYLEATRRTDP